MPSLIDSPSEEAADTDLIGYWLRLKSSCIIIASSSASSSTGYDFLAGFDGGTNVFGTSTGAILVGWTIGATGCFSGAELVINAFSNI